MRLRISLYIYIYIHIYIYIFIHIYIHIYISLCVFVYICMLTQLEFLIYYFFEAPVLRRCIDSSITAKNSFKVC